MRFLLGFVTALIVLALGGLAVVWTGAYNVAASDPHFDPVRWAFDTTFHNSVRRRAENIPVPARFTEEQVRAGFTTFDGMCVQCHGAPGEKRAEWALGMRPRPPHLSEEATHWNSAQIFWILRHGVKMSGMPALGPTHDDETLWNVVAFVEQLPSMTPQEYAALKQEIGPTGHHGSGVGQGSQGASGGGQHGSGEQHGAAGHLGGEAAGSQPDGVSATGTSAPPAPRP